MMGKQGNELQGVGLTQGNTKVSTGTFKGATTFNCHEDGTLVITWLDDKTDTFTFKGGEAFPIKCKSIRVSSGTFSIGYD